MGEDVPGRGLLQAAEPRKIHTASPFDPALPPGLPDGDSAATLASRFAAMISKDELQTRFAAALAAIEEEEARWYAVTWPVLCLRVNRAIGERDDLRTLIGPNPISVLQSNHENHAAFLASVFVLRSAQCLTEVVLWVYRSYLARGFSPEYFRIEYAVWQTAIRSSRRKGRPPEGISGFYATLAAAHDDLVRLSEGLVPADPGSVPDEAAPFLAALLRADERAAETLTRERIRHAVGELPHWWERVVAPALRTIGDLWSEGHLNVAEEHVATAIAQRVMDRCFPDLPYPPQRDLLVAIVHPPGERHDLAGRMLRDCLRLEGVSVLLTGADTPIEAAVALVESNPIDALIVPTTMPYHLIAAADLIRAVRSCAGVRRPWIAVGGQAYDWDPNLWRQVGADAHHQSLRTLVPAVLLLRPGPESGRNPAPN